MAQPNWVQLSKGRSVSMVAMDMKAVSTGLISSTWFPFGLNGTVMKNEASPGAIGAGLATCSRDGDENGACVEQAVRAIKAANIQQTLVLSFIALDFM
jgi:hypothetical protein